MDGGGESAAAASQSSLLCHTHTCDVSSALNTSSPHDSAPLSCLYNPLLSDSFTKIRIIGLVLPPPDSRGQDA